MISNEAYLLLTYISQHSNHWEEQFLKNRRYKGAWLQAMILEVPEKGPETLHYGMRPVLSSIFIYRLKGFEFRSDIPWRNLIIQVKEGTLLEVTDILTTWTECIFRVKWCSRLCPHWSAEMPFESEDDFSGCQKQNAPTTGFSGLDQIPHVN